MKRRITPSIALALSVVLLSLASFDSTAKAAPPLRFNADSGIIALGPNQVLRIMVATGLDSVSVRFGQIEYAQDSCDAAGVCKHIISSQTTSNLYTANIGGGLSAEFSPGVAMSGIRCVVSTNSPNVRVKGLIIDTTTGKVDAFFDIFVEI